MNKEKICLIITGVICLFGCTCLTIFNMMKANYAEVEVIPKWDYNEAVSLYETSCEQEGNTEGTININTASAEELAEFLPGIGEVKARKIVEYREVSGGFISVDELIKVDGIGEKTLDHIKAYCRISD